MSYTVLARRYRSRSFDELVGQEPIARTLEHAIAAGRTGHAYLFCGTRGVGKTSLARLFARALNVPEDLEEAEAIGEAIFRGDDLDVIEIDGASNRGIQEAKDLIAGAGLSPARCPYKIYIIDEVHALTRDAFNALLKTMEEPPAHVKFILCTTEPQKVPATIQSRCQRFDFRAIPTPLIAARLERILADEGAVVDDGVVMLVARLGRGSMRDALSLLDRLLAVGDGPMSLARAEEVLGLPDHTLVTNVVEAIIEHDPGAALAAGAALVAGGCTVEQSLELIAEHLRVLLVILASGAESDLVSAAPDLLEVAVRQSGHFDEAAVVYLIALVDATRRNARESAAAAALFDAALVRMCLSERLADVAALLSGRAGGPPAPAATGRRQNAGGGRKKKGERSPGTGGPGGERIVEVKDAPPASGARGAAGEGERIWDTVLRATDTSPREQAIVRHLRFESFDGGTLHLVMDAAEGTPVRFLRTQTERLGELVQRATGRTIRVALEGTDEGPAVADVGSAARADDAAVAKAAALPLVQKAMGIFDAVVTEVRDDAGPSPSAPAGKGTDDA